MNDPQQLSTVAARLRYAREAAELSGSELSRLAGLTRTAVLTIESRDADIQTRTARALSTVLGVSLEWLVSGGAAPSARAIRTAVARAREAAAQKGAA